MPYHRCGNNNPTSVLMGSLSTLCLHFSPPPPFDWLFSFKNNPSYLFIFGLFSSLEGLLSVAGRSHNSNFQSYFPPKMQNASNNGLSLYQPLPSLSWHSFFTFGSCSQSVIVFCRVGRRVKKTDIWHFMWRNVVQRLLAIQLSTFRQRNVFSLTNAGYQVSASHKSVGSVNGNRYQMQQAAVFSQNTDKPTVHFLPSNKWLIDEWWHI